MFPRTTLFDFNAQQTACILVEIPDSLEPGGTLLPLKIGIVPLNKTVDEGSGAVQHLTVLVDVAPLNRKRSDGHVNDRCVDAAPFSPERLPLYDDFAIQPVQCFFGSGLKARN